MLSESLKCVRKANLEHILILLDLIHFLLFCLSESLLWWTAMFRWDNPQRHWPGRGLFLQQGAIDLFIADSLERTGYACELKLLYFQAMSLNNSRYCSRLSVVCSGSECFSWFLEILHLVPSNTVPQLNGVVGKDIGNSTEIWALTWFSTFGR